MKKAFNKAMAFVLAFAVLVPFSAHAHQKGDVNGDGIVDRTDGELVFNYVAAGGNFTQAQKSVADIDGDGRITVGDATQILRYASGREKKLPASAISHLNILSPPHKLKYKVGEAFSMEGFKLSVTYTNGQTRLTDKYTHSGFSGTAGTKIITVSSYGRLISFTVNVEQPQISELQLARLPSKRNYRIGQTLSLTGLKLNAVYANGSTEELSGYSVSGYSGEAGVHRVKLMYMGKTAEFEVGCGYSAVINCGGTRLNVRTGPSTSYAKKSAFLNGTSIIVTDRTGENGWVQCWGADENGNYVYGWCSAEYIDIND
ncbi:MAG: bacterial Ig-like domain-containing protein [Clostridia bacterium]|nr:bacterial Ig-like domain-containing protein [Clostridia bacterium]